LACDFVTGVSKGALALSIMMTTPWPVFFAAIGLA
jgi:hypothetical protein